MVRTWFIAGASSGFGRLMTEVLLVRGDRVAAVSRGVKVLNELKDRYPDHLWTQALDLTETYSISQTVSNAFVDLGRIDVVVNNAGYGVFGAVEELTIDQIRRQIETNLIGNIEIVRAVIPHLRAQGGGRIIQVSSEAGQTAYPAFSLYHASKWGIEGFVESVAQEVAPFKVEFSIVEPGGAKTGFRERMVYATPMAAYENTVVGEIRRAFASGGSARRGDPQKIAEAIIASVDQTPAPRRIALGSESFEAIRAALVTRLSELDAQKDLATSTDLDELMPRHSKSIGQ
ncbi:SDR family oxidoreductase [Bradyrhizobium sp. 5.13L]